MIRFMTLSSLLILATTFPLCGQMLEDEEVKQYVDDFLSTYDPQGYQMINMLMESPTEIKSGNSTIMLSKPLPPSAWVFEQSVSGVLSSLSTIVHEMSHSFSSTYPYQMRENTEAGTDDWGFGQSYSAFYLSADEIHLVEHTPVFNSQEIQELIPENMRTFRFSPYISPVQENLGSQVSGVYGLMDEWTAYYNGTRNSLNMFDYFHDRASDDNITPYLRYLQGVASPAFAYFEFKYFILTYLRMAKDRYPEIYRDILANRSFSEAYGRIDFEYKKLQKDFQQKQDEIEAIARDKGLTVRREEDFYYIGSSGVGIYLDVVQKLKNELAKPAFKELDRAIRE